MHRSSVSWDRTLLYCFSQDFIWFLQKEPIKVQSFREISTAEVKFHQICTLIGSFCWKYIKFQLKKYTGVMSHDTEDWCKISRKINLLFQKWWEFGEYWSYHSKVSKIWAFIGPFCGKYITFDLKSTGELSFMTLKSFVKFEEKLACGLENDTRNLAIFTRALETLKNLDFNELLFTKV